MGRRYILTGENFTVGTGYILAAIQPAAANAAGSILEIERIEVGQNSTSTSAQCRLFFANRDTAGTLTVTSATPSPIVLGGPASGITGGTSPLTAAKCGINSSADSGGTYVYGPYYNFNNQGGFLWQPIPQHTILVVPGKVFCVGMAAAPSDTAGWSINVWYHELF